MSETAEAYHNLKEILDHIKDAYAPNLIRACRADFSGGGRGRDRSGPARAVRDRVLTPDVRPDRAIRPHIWHYHQ